MASRSTVYALPPGVEPAFEQAFEQGDLLALLAHQVRNPRPDFCPDCGAAVTWDGDRMRAHPAPTSRGTWCNWQRGSWADDPVMVESLRAVVPLWLAEIRAVTVRDPEMRRLAAWQNVPLNCDNDARDLYCRRWMSDAASKVGEMGDVLAHGSKRSGRAAEVFNHLARGLAALAQTNRPEGVDLWGLHWCVDLDCARCRPSREPETATRAELEAELERLDAEFRALTGMPPWTPPVAERPPVRRSTPARQRRAVEAIATGGHL